MSDASSRFLPSSRSSDRPFSYTVRMPIDDAVDSMADAVQQLKTRNPQDLRRARRHHRRALAALENGSYETLADDTRSQLVTRLRADLEALDRALNQLDGPGASSGPGSTSSGSGSASTGEGTRSRSDGWLSAALG